MRNEVLLLNANATPVSWLPLSSISWQNAVRLIWLDVVEVLHTYDDWVVHSPSTIITVPSVVMLRKQVSGFRRWLAREDSPQPHLVYLRDLFVCQYCRKQFPRSLLTIDHVTPKMYGGRTVWQNVASACSPCNSRRGSDIRIRPMMMPYRPTYFQLVKKLKSFPIIIPDLTWNYYLQWNEDLVRMIHPRQHIVENDNLKIDLSEPFDLSI